MVLLLLTSFGLVVLADVTSVAGTNGVDGVVHDVLNAGATTSWLRVVAAFVAFASVNAA